MYNATYDDDDDGAVMVVVMTTNDSAGYPLTDAASPSLRWGVLALVIFIVASVVGNALVCIAVCWERRLQNMTNYFLMSLAVADLLVSLLVMPLAMIVELYGFFPFDPRVCVIWATMDVLMCTASIWHMCTMSMDRFFTLKYPMKYGRNKTKAMVRVKIAFVWIVSMGVCSPVFVLGFIDYSNVYTADRQCMPVIHNFVIYGSIFAFYVPLLTMIVTYVLTIRILCNNQSRLKNLADRHYKKSRQRKERNGLRNCYRSVPPSEARSPAVDATDGVANGGARRKSGARTSGVEAPPCHDTATTTTPTTPDDESGPAPGPAPGPARAVALHPSRLQLERVRSLRGALSVSQPHLPSAAATGRGRWEAGTTDDGTTMLKAASYLSVHDLESVRNYKSLSRASLNSFPSDGGSAAWREFEVPRMLRKLTRIENEMDYCLVAKARGAARSSNDNNDDDGDDDDDDANDDDDDDDDDSKMALRPSCANNNNAKDGIGYASVSFSMGCEPIPQATELLAPPSNSANSERTVRRTERRKSLVCSVDIKLISPLESSTGLSNNESNTTTSPNDADCQHTGLELPDRCQAVASNGEPKFSLIQMWRTRKRAWAAKTGQSVAEDSTEDSSAEDSSRQNSRSLRLLRSVSSWRQRSFARHSSAARETPDLTNGSTRWHTLSRDRPSRGQPPRWNFPRFSKRKTINEKKASKVLGIIFAVFVVLWTPFFIMNVTSAVCARCAEFFTPSVAAAIIWLGYLSSLANPIIYTMFNTAFRRAFYKIITCQYHCTSRQRRKKMAESIYLTTTRQTSEPRR